MAEQTESLSRPAMGLAQVMHQLASGSGFADLVNLAANDPDGANGMMGMAAIFVFSGNLEMAADLQAKALKLRQHFSLIAATADTTIRLLAIVQAGGMRDNTPLEFLLPDDSVALDLLFIGDNLPLPHSLPPHDLIFVAIAPPDLTLLKRAAAIIQSTARPVLNAPQYIAELSREAVSKALDGIPGLEIPRTLRLSRLALLQIRGDKKCVPAALDADGFPFIIRPTDSHAGEGLARIDDAAALAAYLVARPEAEFHVARFIDYRSRDGCYRKCRLVLIDGRPYVVHLAIHEQWMVHYNNAAMTTSAAKRLQEEDFMRNFDHDFASRHRVALRKIGEHLRLDYLVIDCGETPDGRLLLFEADNIGFVHAMDPADTFPYKQPVLRKLHDAFHAMLEKANRRQSS